MSWKQSQLKMILHIMKSFNHYQIAVALSTTSLAFGILREFLIVGLLGFSSQNDMLQLYLSIFYSIGLTIDAMRLACLNLYSVLSLPRILICATVISLPLAFMTGYMMSISTGKLNTQLLLITILGSYLNLIAALLITYKQRHNYFLSAQIINVLPNFILIPGILVVYLTARENLIEMIIYLTSLIPVVQCVFLLLLGYGKHQSVVENEISIFAGILTFTRHFAAMISEQFYQIITRAAFFNYGVGYLSLFSIIIRIYSAARFILVDSFIGSKLANWRSDDKSEKYFSKMFNLFFVGLLIVVIAFIASLQLHLQFLYTALQMSFILLIGFCFSTLVRIVYFKINRHQNNPRLVLKVALIELACLLASYILIYQYHSYVLTLLWIGYIAKPFCQLLLLRKYYHGLNEELSYGNSL